MITVNKANPTAAEERTSLVNASDGAGLHLEAGGTITLANAAAAEFGTSDFSLEFVLNRTANNTNNNVIYESHSAGNNRVTLKALTGGDLVATFTNSSGVNADYNTGYDIDVDLNTVTHYALTFDRSGDLTVYKNGNSVATISIAASSAVDIGASNTNTGRIGYVTTYGIIGTFYRFRAFNTLADAKLLFERADVPQTLTANLLFDLDLAFANPTQSLTVQDRKGNTDGTATASGVTQVQPVVQLNSTSARIGTSAATPADGEIVSSGKISANSKININSNGTLDWGNAADYGVLTWGGTTDAIVRGAASKNLKLGADNQNFVTIDSTGNVTANVGTYLKISRDDSYPRLELYRNDASIGNGNTIGQLNFGGADANNSAAARINAKADSHWTANSSATAFEFQTCPDGSETLATALTIDSSGLATFSGGITVSGGSTNIGSGFPELTISSGAITVTDSTHRVDTESDSASDDLDTINGGTQGSILALRSVDNSRDVTVRDATGNIYLAGDFALNHAQRFITLIKYGGGWYELSRSANA